VGVTNTNKCNINSTVATLIDNRKWGLATSKDVYKSIIENYRVYLNCLEQDIDICYPDDCENVAETVVCPTIDRIEAVVTAPIVVFTAHLTSSSSTTRTYTWKYDTYIFDFVSSTDNTITLSTKANVDLLTTTAMISVTVVDDKNCSSTKTCYLVAGVMLCDYTPCNNVYDLVVTLNTQ